MNLNRNTILMLFLLSLTTAEASNPKYIPVASGQFSTGQWYFDGERSSLSGNIGLNFVPALQFSESFTLIPTIESNYRGTRSAEELAGGNTLFQDTWENALGIKGVHRLTEKWSMRERLNVRTKWFRETTDETWTNGLYDYQSYSLGGEIERNWRKKVSLALGYDISVLEFPNYNSLESTQGADLSREFAGSNVLDSTIHLFSLRLQSPFVWGTKSNIQMFFNPRLYSDQTVTQLSGLLSSEKRKDTRVGSQISLERMFKTSLETRLMSSVYYGYTSMNSNQNHHDTNYGRNSEPAPTFISDYYDYDQQNMGVQFSLGFGKLAAGAMVADLGYSYARRDYRSRLIQGEDGTYLSSKLNTEETALNLGFSYPLSKNFRARASSTFGHSKSNNDFEAVYKYNYSNSNYQFGFTYEY